MTLSRSHPQSKLMKRFAALGPYLREGQCQDNHFFFDCLAVCIDAGLAPEKREFWGWWIELEAKDNVFIYSYRLGIFDRGGGWKTETINQLQVQEKLETTLHDFYKRLHALLGLMALRLEPAKDFNGRPMPND